MFKLKLHKIIIYTQYYFNIYQQMSLKLLEMKH